MGIHGFFIDFLTHVPYGLHVPTEMPYWPPGSNLIPVSDMGLTK
jgi:hypothetical protein